MHANSLKVVFHCRHLGFLDEGGVDADRPSGAALT